MNKNAIIVIKNGDEYGVLSTGNTTKTIRGFETLKHAEDFIRGFGFTSPAEIMFNATYKLKAIEIDGLNHLKEILFDGENTDRIDYVTSKTEFAVVIYAKANAKKASLLFEEGEKWWNNYMR